MTAHGFDEVLVREVVVVGGGVAGLVVALGATPLSVALVTKSRLGRGGSSVYAQGGMAAAVGEGDSPAFHAADTLAAGACLGDPEAVALLTREGPAAVARLVEWGVGFDRDARGGFALGREGAHGRRRILHAGGDATGAELVRALTAAVRRHSRVTLLEELFALDLVTLGGRVVGLTARDAAGRRLLLLARAVVLATGGLGRLYLYTTNPPENTADGLAMAARAGARLADLEFVQFHPTALVAGRDPLPLLTEALRGEGAVLVDGSGHRFMPGEHPAAELAPRDVVARAIGRRRMRGEEVFLDAREAVGDAFPERFPQVFSLCQEAGLDPRREFLPVTPAAHYQMGGIAVDPWGRASLPGLWACGEVACTGVHGANRLASNSLLEAVVFGRRVALDLTESTSPPVPVPRVLAALPERREAPPAGRPAPAAAARVTVALRRLAWDKVGLERDEAALTAAVEGFEELAAAHPGLTGEGANLLTAGRLVALAARARRESRGGHFRRDYPAADPAGQRRQYLVMAPGSGPDSDPRGDVEITREEAPAATAAVG